MIFGEITTSATVNYKQVIRDAPEGIGYIDPAKGFDCKPVMSLLLLRNNPLILPNPSILKRLRTEMPVTRVLCLDTPLTKLSRSCL
jgi:hypothetical protein